MDECHKCGGPIKWSRSAVSFCHCGADWRDAQLPSLPDSETVVSRFVLQRFGLLSYDDSDSKDCPFYDLPLASAFEGLFLIVGHIKGLPMYLENSFLVRRTFSKFTTNYCEPFSFSMLGRRTSMTSSTNYAAAINP